MANFYRIGSAGLNWSNVGSWSSTSGGASNGLAEPTSSDDVFFNASSPATVTVSSPAVGLSLTITRTLTITINSSLTITNTISASTTLTCSGTTGFTCGDFNITATSAATITFANTVEYTVTGTFYCYSSRVGSIVLFTSDHASNKALITVSPGAECRILASFTRINASNGRPLRAWNGTITDCVYIDSFYDLKTVA